MLTKDSTYLDIVHRGELLIEQASRMVIDTDEDLGKAGDLAKLIRAVVTAMEDRRKALVSPLNDQVKTLNKEAKELARPMVEAQGFMKVIMDEYVREKDRIAREKAAQRAKEVEEEALRDAEILEKAGHASAADAVLGSVAQGAAISLKKSGAGSVRGLDVGSVVSARTSWKWRTSNIDLVPRRFMVLDVSGINSLLREVRESLNREADAEHLKGVSRETFIAEGLRMRLHSLVPGIEFYQDTSASVR